MDILDKLFSHIESLSFVSSAYTANTLASFTVYAESTADYKLSLNSISSKPNESSKRLFERVKRLLTVKNDIKFVHPYDASIAVYLYMLYQLDLSSFGQIVKDLRLPANTWWSKQMLAVLSKNASTIPTIERVKVDEGELKISPNNAIAQGFFTANELKIGKI